jgi:hypothetical protein
MDTGDIIKRAPQVLPEREHPGSAEAPARVGGSQRLQGVQRPRQVGLAVEGEAGESDPLHCLPHLLLPLSSGSPRRESHQYERHEQAPEPRSEQCRYAPPLWHLPGADCL